MTAAFRASGLAAAPTALDAPEQVRLGLESAAEELGRVGVPVPALEGKLLRPLVAWALVPPERRGELDLRFWHGALAVQMVHEASLLHDDILDDAQERRGSETVVARKGVGPALVLGDHYLTGAYRAAARSEAPAFLACFIRAVERTVAGEIAQGRSAGRRLDSDAYHAVVTGKSGELFGAAACLGGALLGTADLEERGALGRDLGAVYQRVDDLLDYCTAAETGKPPLQDYRQKKWTWVLDMAGVQRFDLPAEAVLDALFLPRDGGPSAAQRAVGTLEELGAGIRERARVLSPGDTLVGRILDAWTRAARRGVEAQERTLGVGPSRAAGPGRAGGASTREAEVAELAKAVGGPEEWSRYFGRHARTFRFAARLFPPEEARRIAEVYAYCRFTDDLVDEPADDAGPDVVGERLEAWRCLTRNAFEGHATGVPLLDVTLAHAASAGVSWLYPDALLHGVGLDLSRARYADWDDLESYTFGVAGAVGGWITQLFGFRDPELLERAHALGHAMQLTNIVRDVGEDLARDRLYVPTNLLVAHGLDEAVLRALAAGEGLLPSRYKAAMEDLMARADEWYDLAWPGIQALPAWYRRPVAVAAEAYRGIHREVRKAGHDNLRRRAATGLRAKLMLGAAGLMRSRAGS